MQAGKHAPYAGEMLGFLDIRDCISSFLSELAGLGLEGMNLLQAMRVLEEQGLVFSNTQLGSLETLGMDGGFIHASKLKVSLLEFMMYGLLDPRAR
jgi:hypothetical protein